MAVKHSIHSLLHHYTFRTSDIKALRQDAEKIESKKRLAQQLETIVEIITLAEKMGIKERLFVIGGLAHEQIRNYRLHGDIDIKLQHAESFQKIYRALIDSGKFIDTKEKFLKGWSMTYLMPTDGRMTGPIELRYTYPVKKNGHKIWNHVLPKLMQAALLGRSIIVPDIAYSFEDEYVKIGNKNVRFVRPEYSYLIKYSSPYAKDQTDAYMLKKIIDKSLASQIEDVVKQTGNILVLHHFFMTFIRSFGCFSDGLDTVAYTRLLNGDIYNQHRN